jgi:hypothetical protein
LNKGCASSIYLLADPIGTTILARSNEEMAEVIRQHPEADYFRAGEFTLANSGYRAK